MTQEKRKKRRVSNCRQKTQEGKCLGKYQLTYDSSAPIFTCDTCGDQELTWQKFYNEYLQLYKQKENWDVKKDQVSCIIGFFCYMYKEVYNTDYVFVPKNPNPYGAKECKDSWLLLSAFNGDAHEVRKYLYWVFKKGINHNTSITHFGYVNTPGLIRKYNLYAQKKHTLTRASKLPAKFIDWCKDNTPDIFNNYALTTMNDLGALLGYINAYREELADDGDEIKSLSIAVQLNLIKDGKLNIGQ